MLGVEELHRNQLGKQIELAQNQVDVSTQLIPGLPDISCGVVEVARESFADGQGG